MSDLSIIVWILAAFTKFIHMDDNNYRYNMNLLIICFDIVINNIIYEYVTVHDSLFYAWFSFALITTFTFKPMWAYLDDDTNITKVFGIKVLYCLLLLIQTILIYPLYIANYTITAASIITIFLSTISFIVSLLYTFSNK
jgi:hypothetical protein